MPMERLVLMRQWAQLGWERLAPAGRLTFMHAGGIYTHCPELDGDISVEELAEQEFSQLPQPVRDLVVMSATEGGLSVEMCHRRCAFFARHAGHSH